MSWEQSWYGKAYDLSLMDEISLFVEENCEAEILDEEREIR